MTQRKTAQVKTQQRHVANSKAPQVESVRQNPSDSDTQPQAYNETTIAGQQDMQRDLLKDLYQALGNLEVALIPVTTMGPAILNRDSVVSDGVHSGSPVVAELAIRNSLIAAMIHDVHAIKASLTIQ